MLPAGNVTRYWPSVTASLVPSLSERVGQSLSLLSKDSKKSWPLLADGVAPCDPTAADGPAVGDVAGVDGLLLPQAATATTVTAAAARRARVGTLTNNSRV